VVLLLVEGGSGLHHVARLTHNTHRLGVLHHLSLVGLQVGSDTGGLALAHALGGLASAAGALAALLHGALAGLAAALSHLLGELQGRQLGEHSPQAHLSGLAHRGTAAAHTAALRHLGLVALLGRAGRLIHLSGHLQEAHTALLGLGLDGSLLSLDELAVGAHLAGGLALHADLGAAAALALAVAALHAAAGGLAAALAANAGLGGAGGAALNTARTTTRYHF
jgi:hypothetical protein